MASPVVDREKVIQVILDAKRLGDAKAAELHGLDIRTVRRYRMRTKGDPKLSSEMRAQAREDERGWSPVRHRFLRFAVEKLRQMIAEAGPDQIRDVSEAIERIGNIDIAMHALLGDDADPESPSPAEDAGGPTEDAEASEGSEDPRQSDDVMDRLFGKLEGDSSRRESDPSSLRPEADPPEE